MNFSVDLPISIIFLVLVTAFLVLRLRSVLGNRTGFERKPEKSVPVSALQNSPVIEGVGTPVQPPKVIREIPGSESEVGQCLTRITQIEPSFNPNQFLEGAEIVFRKVLEAFANGDKQTLQNFLVSDAYHSFESAITARQDAKETQKIEVKHIYSETITNAKLFEDQSMNRALIEVKFISDQINVTMGKDNNPVVGTESVTEFVDFWTFERLLGVNTQGASWRLKSARSAA